MSITPHARCRLKLLKSERIKDYLLMEQEFIQNQERLKPQEERQEEERTKASLSLRIVDELRGTPMAVGSLEEIIDDQHAIVSTNVGSEHYVNIMSFVDKEQLEPGCAVLLNHKSIVFIDEIDAVGTKRYDSNSGGEREIQRTMLELLNQLDGFDSRGDVKVLMATNRIESLDPALIRPGRIDRKIEFPLPDEKTKRRIFQIHTSRMTLSDDVNLEEFILAKDELSGADIKAMCTEAGLLALRERRMRVTMEDFQKSKENVLYRKKEGAPEELYL
ncbi:ATPase, AAA family [Necator americanus]|uniref:ATPase, AAA family n=1 Tax=Necator americanus TaxID=51031 RepID=W2T6U3_NECAM|nr:ATPase, AAA family [Necator americanus]ETN77344.1 ATPase, AAA family [Necator americanus]